VRIGASGVCHSDLSVVRGQYPKSLPLITGYEGAGTVIETGPEVGRVRVGDRAISSFVPACGRCWHCLRGSTHLCESTEAIRPFCRGSKDGVDLAPQNGTGTMAETMTVHEE